MIKVLYLPLNSKDNVQQGMYDAWNDLSFVNMRVFDFLNIHESGVNISNVNQMFLREVEEFQPDLVHMQLQMTKIILPGSINLAREKLNKKCIFTNWSGDVRNSASKEMIDISKAVDYSFISSVGQLDLYKNSGGKNIEYWQIGYDHKLFYPLNKKEFKYDLVFAGNAYSQSAFADSKKRTDMVIELKKYFKDRFMIFGSGYNLNLGQKISSISFKDLNEAYNNSRCILSISNYNDISHYFSDRLLICLASGRPTISYRFPDYETYFSHNSDILISHSVNDIINQVEYCKKNPEFADKIGRNGAAKVKAEHTYKSRAVELLKIIGLQ